MVNLMIIGICLVSLAAGMAVVELVLYKRRHSYEGEIFRYTHKRLVRRLSSAGVLAVIAVMLVAGVIMADKFRNPAFFSYYWIAFLIFVLALAVFPVLDFIETYRGYKERYLRQLAKRARMSSQKRGRKNENDQL